MRVAVLGAGYVGAVTAAGLARLGHDVRVGEVDPDRVAAFKQGTAPFYEPGLDALIARGLLEERLVFTTSNLEAIAGADVVLLTLPTPTRPDGNADLTILESVAHEVARHLGPDAALAIKSTATPGTAARLSGELGRPVVSNPEFLREGSAVEDFFRPDRVVVGGDDPAAVDRVADLYAAIDAPVVRTDPTSAELIKYGSNAHLAMRVTFANALANLCEALGGDAEEVLRGIGMDRRIGPAFLKPGPGYGGSCFPKDIAALVASAEAGGYYFELLRTVQRVNEEQQRRIVSKAADLAGGSLRGKNVALWGLAFKAGTDDTRESPAIGIARRLVEHGASVRAYDPRARRAPHGVAVADDPVVAAKDADVLVIATEWPEFADVPLDELASAMARPAIVDARNLLDPDEVRAAGFAYTGIGRR